MIYLFPVILHENLNNKWELLETLGFKSMLWKVKTFFVLFLFILKFCIENLKMKRKGSGDSNHRISAIFFALFELTVMGI